MVSHVAVAACRLTVASFLILVALDDAAGQPVSPRPSVRHVALSVPGGDSGWQSTGIDVDAGDVIAVRATGFVTVGRFSRRVDARGVHAGGSLAQGTEYLELRVGHGTPTFVGTNKVYVAIGSGMLAFHVYDVQYDDNAGAFTVDAIVLPAALIPDAISPREVGMAPASDVAEWLRHSLKTFATAQEVFFVEHMRYAPTVEALALTLPAGTVVERLTLNVKRTGWSAVVRHQDLPDLRCGTAIGMPNPLDPSATDMQLVCR